MTARSTCRRCPGAGVGSATPALATIAPVATLASRLRASLHGGRWRGNGWEVTGQGRGCRQGAERVPLRRFEASDASLKAARWSHTVCPRVREAACPARRSPARTAGWRRHVRLRQRPLRPLFDARSGAAVATLRDAHDSSSTRRLCRRLVHGDVVVRPGDAPVRRAAPAAPAALTRSGHNSTPPRSAARAAADRRRQGRRARPAGCRTDARILVPTVCVRRQPQPRDGAREVCASGSWGARPIRLTAPPAATSRIYDIASASQRGWCHWGSRCRPWPRRRQQGIVAPEGAAWAFMSGI